MIDRWLNDLEWRLRLPRLALQARLRAGLMAVLALAVGAAWVTGLSGSSAPASAPVALAQSFPGATTTGVPEGTTLTPVNGRLVITKAGSIVDGKDINGCVEVKANDVTIKRSRIRCTGYYTVRQYAEYSGLVIEDSEIDGLRSTKSVGVAFGRYTLRRVDIHGVEDGVQAGSLTDLTP